MCKVALKTPAQIIPQVNRDLEGAVYHFNGICGFMKNISKWAQDHILLENSHNFRARLLVSSEKGEAKIPLVGDTLF